MKDYKLHELPLSSAFTKYDRAILKIPLPKDVVNQGYEQLDGNSGKRRIWVPKICLFNGYLEITLRRPRRKKANSSVVSQKKKG